MGHSLMEGTESEGFHQVVDGGEPYGSRGVGGHTPVAARRKAYRTYFRAVGQAGAFELLAEEAAVEHPHPFQNRSSAILPYFHNASRTICAGIVLCYECLDCKIIDSLRAKPVAQSVI